VGGEKRMKVYGKKKQVQAPRIIADIWIGRECI
jgi:hypothetical protein